MAHLGTPSSPQIPPGKSLCGSLFCVLSQQMRHIKFYLEGDFGGPHKVYVEQVVYVLLLLSLIRLLARKPPSFVLSNFDVESFGLINETFRAGHRTTIVQ